MDSNEIYALAALGAGLLVGMVAALLVRRTLRLPRRREELHRVANPAGALVFWLAFVAGAIVALGLLRPESLDPLPSRIITYLPSVLVAGLILLAGYVGAAIASNLVGRRILRTGSGSGRHLATALRVAIIGAAIVLALGELGVNTTILTIIVAAIAFGLAGAAALLVGLGGRDVARELAAGRYLQRLLAPGDTISAAQISGRVVTVRPATVELETKAGETVHVPHSVLLREPLCVSADSGERSSA